MSRIRQKISQSMYLIVIATLSLSTSSQATISQSVIFEDGIFNISEDWDVKVDTGVPPSTIISTPMDSGGDPDEYLRIVANLVSGPGVVYAFYRNVHADYDPHAGAIEYINYSESSIMFDGVGQGQASLVALEQDGILYRALPWLHTNLNYWTTQTLSGLTASDFFRDSSSGDHPDFSLEGGRISFGFSREISNSVDDGYTIDAGIDNWKVEVIVPEPASLLLLGLGGLGLMRKRR